MLFSVKSVMPETVKFVARIPIWTDGPITICPVTIPSVAKYVSVTFLGVTLLNRFKFPGQLRRNSKFRPGRCRQGRHWRCLRRWCGQRWHSQHSGNDCCLNRTEINLHINTNSTQIIDNITASVGRSGNILYLYDGNILKHFHSFQALFCFECSVDFCQPKQDLETSDALI